MIRRVIKDTIEVIELLTLKAVCDAWREFWAPVTWLYHKVRRHSKT